MSSKRIEPSAKRASVRSIRACTSGSTALSIRPSTERQTTRAPSRMMLAATPIAITGSSQSQPVTSTSSDADDDAGRGPDVGVEMARVGLERDRAMQRAMPPSSSTPAGRSAPSWRRSASGRCRRLQRLQVHEALQRGPDDGDRGARRSSGPRRRSRNTRPWCGRTDGRRRPGARRSSPSPGRTAPRRG